MRKLNVIYKEMQKFSDFCHKFLDWWPKISGFFQLNFFALKISFLAFLRTDFVFLAQKNLVGKIQKLLAINPDVFGQNPKTFAPPPIKKRKIRAQKRQKTFFFDF